MVPRGRKIKLPVCQKALELSEENIGCKLHDLGFGNNFMDKALKTQAEKEKLD